MTRSSLTDVDGVDGPFVRRMRRPARRTIDPVLDPIVAEVARRRRIATAETLPPFSTGAVVEVIDDNPFASGTGPE